MNEQHARLILPLLLAILFSAQLIYPQETPSAETKTVYIIPIHGDIMPPLMVFIKRGIEKAEENNPDYIIFDIDTFGGRVDTALQITTLIGSLKDIHTIAFVNLSPEGTGVSWSAGALISFSCDSIYMAPGTSIGAAAPIIQGASGESEPAGEKTVSAVRTQMAAIAEKNGYPRGVALAMVDQEVLLLEVYIDGDLRLMTEEEYEEARRRAEEEGTEVEKGKVVSDSGKLLSLTAGQMADYKISSGTVVARAGLLEELEVSKAQVTVLEESPADEVVALLTGTAVSSLLILVGLIALFMEISSPGFGIPGTVAVLCFAVLFTSNFLLGTVGSLELLLFVGGVALLVVEIFIIPGFGIVGISGLVMMGISLILSMQSFVIPSFEWEWEEFHKNILTVSANLVGSLILFLFLASMFKNVRFFRRLTLETSQESNKGYTVQEIDEGPRLIGKEGKTVSTLRPVGKAEIAGELLTVESEGEYIPAGTEVVVTEVNGNRYVVRKQ